MTLAEVVFNAARSAGAKQSDARRVLEATFRLIAFEVRNGGRVVIPRFGTFLQASTKPHAVYSFDDGGRKRIGRTARLRLKPAVAQRWRVP